MPHEHILVPIKEALGQHTIYWCRECGLICERMGTNIYEMLPEWSVNRLINENRSEEKYKFLPVKIEVLSKQSLGKGLKDIVSVRSKKLEELLGIKK